MECQSIVTKSNNSIAGEHDNAEEMWRKCGENVEKMLLVRRVGPDKGGHWEIIG